MLVRFLLRIPEKYVDLFIANNYRQRTRKIKENLFEIKVRDTPKSIKELLQKPIDFKIDLEELKNVKHLIETYEDLFYFLRDYIDAKVKNEHKKGESPFWEYYNPKWDNQCGIRNKLFADYLKKLGFDVRLIGGIYLLLEKRNLEVTHVWTEIKVENKWIELDATINLFPLCNIVRLNLLEKWDKFERDFWLKGKVYVEIW